MEYKLGFSGQITKIFQSANITPILALFVLLLGLYSIFLTPREEEPQINVTMADIIVSFPGASAKNVEQMVSVPAEQVLSRMNGIEHIYSMSYPGLSIVTVQFKVGFPRTEALVQLYDTINSHSDWLPQGLGVMPPIIKSKGIDDVPILSLTLFSKEIILPNQELNRSYELEKIANRIEIDLKRVKGTKEVTTIGGPGRIIKVEIDTNKLTQLGFTIQEIHNVLLSVNASRSVGCLLNEEQAIMVESGPFLRNINDVENIVIGVREGKAILLSDVAKVVEGPRQRRMVVYHVYKDLKTKQLNESPGVTITITKKSGENAIKVANLVNDQILQLKANIIPKDIDVAVTRNYGHTANEKANQLIHKLLFATVSVIGLISIVLGRREAVAVGTAVVLTLAATLFASMVYGFTINRVSLFALIFSIGILVDDAIVVIENIHRHKKLNPNKDLKEIIPMAVDEIGAPTILATFTVIASLLPMAFVTGLMGPYMSPIPINASIGMLLSLMIAFIITPWIVYKLFKNNNYNNNIEKKIDITQWLAPKFNKVFTPFFDDTFGYKNRIKLNIGIILAIGICLLLPATRLVVFKMLPFDNKSEFQVVLDMPEGTRIEKTFQVLQEIGRELKKLPELDNYQIYAGTTGPISFNGLVRQYYLRQSQYFGDIQVNLIDKTKRKNKSHIIATRIRPCLSAIAKKHLGNIKLVEVPPGPPVLSAIVAEVYSYNDDSRFKAAKQIRDLFEATKDIVDVDDTSVAESSRKLLLIDRNKSSVMGVSQQSVVNTLKAGLSGEDLTYVYDESKYPVAVSIRLPENEQKSLDNLLGLTIRNSQRDLIPLENLTEVINLQREQTIYHKDLLPVNYVIADASGNMDSPLYGLFAINSKLNKVKVQNAYIKKYFFKQPSDPYQDVSIKWDGEWQITYETFRDLLIAFMVGILLIYLLLVSQFSSYLTPIIIMVPIPLTIIGVIPGHALFKAQFTATSMIGMMALAGIIVRNSILLVDFAKTQISLGVPLKEALIDSVIVRFQPIVLTGLSAILGAFFILDDPIFNGLAISLIFGILISTLLTLIIIPIAYFSLYAIKAKI